MKKSKNKWLVIIIILFSVISLLFQNDTKISETKRDYVINERKISAGIIKTGNQNTGRIKTKNVFAFTICHSNKTGPRNSFARQINQTLVMIKSAVLQTSEMLRFIVLSDEKSNFLHLQKEVDNTFHKSPEYKSKFRLTFQKLVYPEGKEFFREIFLPCSTARLLIPDLLDYDSVVYLDTDVIFFSPPEDLWKHFLRFKESEMVGMSQTMGTYAIFHTNSNFPFFEETGLNAGVLLMNISRIGNFPGGWFDSLTNAYNNYKNHIQYGDQDLLNIIFNKKPELVHQLSCDLNFQGVYCELFSLQCKRGLKYGVSILHGTAASFALRNHFKVAYEMWLNFTVDRSLEDLVLQMDKELVDVENDCIGHRSLDKLMTKRLKNWLKLKRSIWRLPSWTKL